MLALLLAAATTFDVVSYAPPAGFKSADAGKSVTFTRAGANPCEIDLYASVARTGDFGAVFKREWKAKAGKGVALAGDPATATLPTGLPSLAGIGQATDGVTMLTVVDGGTRAVSVKMQVASVPAVAACQDAYTSLLASLAFAGAAPAATPVAAAQAQDGGNGTPTLGPVPAGLRVADLAGTWEPKKALEFATAYYSRSTGAYNGSDASYSASSYTFDSAGNFVYRESGLSHGSSFDDSEHGPAEIADGMLTLHGEHLRRFRLLGYEKRADATFLVMLPDWADPTRKVDMDTYGEYLVRQK